MNCYEVHEICSVLDAINLTVHLSLGILTA